MNSKHEIGPTLPIHRKKKRFSISLQSCLVLCLFILRREIYIGIDLDILKTESVLNLFSCFFFFHSVNIRVSRAKPSSLEFLSLIALLLFFFLLLILFLPAQRLANEYIFCIKTYCKQWREKYETDMIMVLA